MPVPENIFKEHFLRAIEKIDKEGIPDDAASRYYDVVYNDKRYPPKVVVSWANIYANGHELDRNTFEGGKGTPAFKLLEKNGFLIMEKNFGEERETGYSNGTKNDRVFNYRKFVLDCNSANLIVTEEIAVRLISSLITKPFVILTGLSGSGKTKLALAFAKWLSNGTSKASTGKFLIGEEVKSNRVAYVITASDKTAVTFTQSETGTKVTLPFELINEWVEVIGANNFTPETPTRKIRETVEALTKYSTQLNSFETHLKAAAFQLIMKDDKQRENNSSTVSLLAVGADWTNREPLLGYPSTLAPDTYVVPENGALQLIINAINNPQKPHFLILDEMNLSHVERYFADFLSAMESKEPIFLHSGNNDYNGIPPSVVLPANLFIIGTVNIDETTYMFSPKVLDRANVIEFRVDELEMRNFLTGDTTVEFSKLLEQGETMAEDFLKKCKTKHNTLAIDGSVKDDLLKFFIELKQVGSEFGYRTAAEMLRFVAVTTELNCGWSNLQILDAAIMQKLLPKLHGSRRKLEATLKSLTDLCLHDKSFTPDVLNPKKNIDFSDTVRIKYPLSLEKIRRMNNGLISNNFTSYAEA